MLLKAYLIGGRTIPYAELSKKYPYAPSRITTTNTIKETGAAPILIRSLKINSAATKISKKITINIVAKTLSLTYNF